MTPKESISASIVVKNELSKVVLMPGDPLRAKALADRYLTDVVCFNDTRNMLGFTGTYKGKRISTMGHGMGIPSIGIYTHELFTQFGVECVIRIGSAGGLDMDVDPMDVVIAEAASSNSNYGNAYGVPGQLAACADYDMLETAVEAAKKNQVPLKYWSALQKGETIEADGVTYTPDLVMGQARKGLKVVYATDTRINPLLRQYSQKADLLITEGMYGDPEKKEKAQDNRHMMMQEAANLAKDNEVKELWLTHYSPSMKDPYIYTEEIQKIFPHTILAHDGQFTDLAFDHEEESPCLK